jgi:hypothetical protein
VGRGGITAGVALVALAAALAGCGGGGSSATTTGVAGARATKTGAAAERARIRQAWTRFFSGATSAAAKASLLQNGSSFAAAIRAQERNPLASKSSATVTAVTLEGPTKATVVYTIAIAGTPALKHQTGTAVKQNGSWKVGDRSFCNLLRLGGAAPAACSSSG